MYNVCVFAEHNIKMWHGVYIYVLIKIIHPRHHRWKSNMRFNSTSLVVHSRTYMHDYVILTKKKKE